MPRKDVPLPIYLIIVSGLLGNCRELTVFTDPDSFGRQESNGGFYPHGPGRDTVYESQREIGRSQAAIALDFAGPTTRGWHSGGGMGWARRGKGSHYLESVMKGA